jgi:hypothetical protein
VFDEPGHGPLFFGGCLLKALTKLKVCPKTYLFGSSPALSLQCVLLCRMRVFSCEAGVSQDNPRLKSKSRGLIKRNGGHIVRHCATLRGMKRPPQKTRRKPRRKPTNRDDQLAVRVTREEKVAIQFLIKQAQKRRPYVSGSDVLRELLGLTYTDLITDEMRRELRIQIDRMRRPQEEPAAEIEDPGTYHNEGESDFPRLVKGD